MNRLLTFAGSDAGLRTAGIVSAFLILTSVASFGANKHKENAALTATNTPPPPVAPAATAPTTAPSTSTSSSKPPGPATAATSGDVNSVPAALRGVDFGLRTQGVTDKEVKVGFSGNFDNCGDTASLVESLPPGLVGDPVKAINTFARYVNDHGGIGGRRYTPDIVQDGGSGCPDRNIPAAVKMADQDKDFLMAPGLHVESDYIIKEHLPVWGGRDDPASLARYGPNGYELLEPITPTIDTWAGFGNYYLHTTNKGGANPGCLIRISNGASGNWDYAQQRLHDDMKRYGITFVDEYTFQDDVSTAQQQANTIAIRERDKGCQHVYFLAGNPIGLIFFTNAATKNHWFPHKWTWTGYTALVDDDKIGKAMDPTQWRNAVGLTYRLPAGVSPYDGNCKNIYEHYNGNDGNGDSASVKLACGAVLSTAEIMKRGVALTGRLDANAFVIGADAIKNNFFFDAHVPMEFDIPSVHGPFKTRAFSHYTVAAWSSTKAAYTFPAYPCYYRHFGPNNAGCEDLRAFYTKK
jgi:hypothetical protein